MNWLINKSKLFKSILIKHKKKSIAIGLILIVLFSTVGIGYFGYGIGMSDNQKSNRINAIIKTKNYVKAREINNRYFNGDDDKSIAQNNLMKSTIRLCESFNVGSMDEVASQYKQLESKVNSLKIVKTEVVNKSYSKTVEITVQNNSNKNINYVKIGLDFKDSKGNIIQSDWTNDDSIIKPNAKQKLTKIVPSNLVFDTVTAEVLEFN
jgi:hypothetical protein